MATSQVPVEGKSSECVICMKYRIIFFNYYHYQPGSNNIIVYGKHIAHACMHTHRRRGCHCSMGQCAPNHDEVNAPFSPIPLALNGHSVLHSNKQSRMRCGIRDSFGCFSRIKKLLGRTETRTRDRICFQSIRTV